VVYFFFISFMFFVYLSFYEFLFLLLLSISFFLSVRVFRGNLRLGEIFSYLKPGSNLATFLNCHVSFAKPA
jgi:hypothetical protein